MSRHFGKTEFEIASIRALTPDEGWLAMNEWAPILDPLRDFCGGPLIVTSYVRGSGSHANAGAVDVQPAAGGNDAVRRVADFAAALYRPGASGSPLRQIIFEMPEKGQKRAHVHLARILVPGAMPGYLLDLAGDRRYTSARIPTITLS